MFAPEDPRPYRRADDELHFVQNLPYGVKWIRANTNDHQPEHFLLFYRFELDKPWWNQVTWDPYPREVVELHHLRHPQDHELWLCKVPLICWHIVEWHTNPPNHHTPQPWLSTFHAMLFCTLSCKKVDPSPRP
ncbi:unnamed protein product [Linum tenue]|uniref:Uncharacterized protein n=1 Tax=Linum tenue TaxID=586396 RepID=A0AAV0LFC7_9ROSI|nr:unnamed protein product [Linum tenue]